MVVCGIPVCPKARSQSDRAVTPARRFSPTTQSHRKQRLLLTVLLIPLSFTSLTAQDIAATLSAAEIRAQEKVGEIAAGGLSFLMGYPLGEFNDFIDASPGFGFFLQYNVDKRGMFGLRLDGSVVFYGSETTRRPLSLTVQRVEVEVVTENEIFSLSLGPQFTVPEGPVRPYLNAGIGFSYFDTRSSVSGENDTEAFASSTNFDDLTFAAAAGGGLLIYLSKNIFLDLSGRYMWNGQVRYLREGSIKEAPDGSISFRPIESETNLLLLQIGVSIRGGKDEEDESGTP